MNNFMKFDFLKGVKVVELGRILSAPYASKLLSDLGAEVIKIEAGNGDPYRQLPPKVGDQSIWFLNFNEGKKFIHIPDLKDWASSEEVVEALKSADILIENFRPGTLKKYGLDFQSIKTLNPNIIYVSISAFGQEGMLAGKPGFDIVVQALAGYLVNYDNNEPIHPHTYLSDYASGLFAAFIAISALFKKERKAVYVDISMFDILVHWSSIFSIILHHDPTYTDLVFRMDPVAFPYESFKTKDGKNIVIAVVGESMVLRFYKAFQKELEEEDIKLEYFQGPSKFPELMTKLSRILKNKNLSDIAKVLDEHRIPWEEIKSGVNLINEPYVIEKQLFEDLPIKEGNVKISRIPVIIKDSNIM